MALEKTKPWLYGLGLGFFALSLPFQTAWAPTALGLMIFGLGWAMRTKWAECGANLVRNPAFVWLSLWFAWNALSGLWSENQSETGRLIGLKIPLFAWALALAGTEIEHRFSTRKLLDVFSAGLALSSLALLITAAAQNRIEGHSSAFFYHALMRWPMIPSHYFSMFLVFGSGWMLHRIARDRGSDKPWILWARLGVLGLFVLMLSLAAIRISVLGLIAVSLLVGWESWPKSRIKVPVLMVMGLGVMGLLMISPETRRRLDETRDEWRSLNGEDTLKQTNARVYIWKHGFSTAAQAPFLGHGLGDANDALQRKLALEPALFWNGTGHYTLSEHRYNYHNAFLQQWAESGIVGLILFAGLFYFAFRNGANFESRLFGMVCLISFATESMLDRQAGVFFFSFFYAVLVIDRLRTKLRARAE